MLTKENTRTKLDTGHVQELMSQLPIARHFQDGLKTSMDNNQKSKLLSLILKLGFLGGVGYLAWKYILPPVFIMLGKFIAVAVTITAAIGFIVLLPAIFKWLNVLAMKIKRAAIVSDPFFELEKQEKLLLENQVDARNAHQRIKGLETDMQLEAKANEDLSQKLEQKILTNQSKAEQMKAQLTAMETKMGPTNAKSTDEYVNINAELLKLLSESHRVSAQLNQAKNFVSKYGTRAHIMKKVSHKLTMVEAAMDSKVLDFRATVDILKKDYEFASKARAATDAAKKAMVFDKTWELEYALDVVATTIANDIAQTAGNFKDINLLTANFDMDSDEMFASLDKIAGQIQTGNSNIPSAKDYSREDYKLSHEDKLNSGGFTDLF